MNELEDNILRYPLAENDVDDMDLMVFNPDDPNAVLAHLETAAERTRAVHLPLWSDLGGAGGGLGGVGGIDGSGAASAASHVTPNHPLLMGRQPGSEASTARTARTMQRHRGGFRGYIHLNSREQGNPSAPTLIRNILGGAGGGQQDIISQTRRGLLVDFGFAILDSLEGGDIPELEGSVLGSNGRAALSTIPAALVRWNEECRVIDGDSMHDCVTALKPGMLQVIEKAKEEELAERRSKRKKAQEEEEAKKKQQQKKDEDAALVAAEKMLVEQENQQQQEVLVAANIAAENAPTADAAAEAMDDAMAVSPSPATATEEAAAVTVTAATTTSATSTAAAHSTTISETAVQLAEGLANAISAGVSSFPGISGAATGITASSTTSATSASSSSIFPPSTLESLWQQTATVVTTAASRAQPTASAAAIAASRPERELAEYSTPRPQPAPAASSGAQAGDSVVGPLSPLTANSYDNSSGGGGERKGSEQDVAMGSELDNSNRQQSALEGTTPLAASSSSGPASFEGVGTSTPREQEAPPQMPPPPPPDALSMDPIASTSGTSNNRGIPPSSNTEYAAILGMDVHDLPEGVDPSFLAALPEDMRQEVIDEQRRLQNIRQRAAQQQEQQGVQEVNPEFLAALPPNIQEEVLAQQRMEQQRQAAAQSNPEAPVDPGEFLQNLPAPLRQSVLADMEESQMSALPADLAAEAQSLRREFEMRNRAMMHERFFSNVHNSGSALSSILRNTVHRMGLGGAGSQYVLNSGSSSNWRTTFARAGASNYPALLSAATNERFRGRQLLDNEGISCLLILLFIDDSKINTTRLHRILRNLCYHSPTRDWVVNSLLSILDKSNESKPELQYHQQQSLACADMPPAAKMRKSTSKTGVITGVISESTTGGKNDRAMAPCWLNISMDAALGFRANVFQVNRAAGKKSSTAGAGDKNSYITIHPGASTIVCRHTLEVLISLAKSFPGHFLPWKEIESSSTKESKDKKHLTSTPVGKGEGKKTGSSSGSASGSSDPPGSIPEFWDTLLKLDLQSSSKKGKSVARSHSSVSNIKGDDDDANGVSFESSPFGNLLGMLSSPVIRRSSVLTDKLLRLLSLISVGQPDNMKKSLAAAAAEEGNKDGGETSKDSSAKKSLVHADHLRLAVEVLTSKSCSEEGLEDVNALLLNLSYGPEPTRDTILQLLLQGAQELGNVVRQNVMDLQAELRTLKSQVSGEVATAAAAATTTGGDEADGGDADAGDGSKDKAEGSKKKGALLDRFTNQEVVLTAPTKVKGGSELQLPAMNALTNKTSSQAFFLRVLKVIIQLRESALLAMKKKKLVKATAAAKEAEQKLLAQVASAPAAASDEAAVPKDEDEQMEVDADDKAEPEKEKGKKADSVEEEQQPEDECLPSLSEELKLEFLWDALSSCLKDLADTPDHHAVLVLQATVEAFFLVHAAATQPDDGKKKVHQKETRQEQLAHIQEQIEPLFAGQEPPKEEEGPEGALKAAAMAAAAAKLELAAPVVSKETQKFLAFAETHRTVLNQILRQSTTHLADGPFSVLVDHTRVLDFDIKRRYFRTELERMDEGMRREDLAVHVKRENVFEDSFRELHRRSPEEWKNRFYIVFEGEEGQDAGGLLREWYVIISREIFNPMYALFKTSPGDKVTYMIYEHSHTNHNHLDYFKFVGRVIAKAIYDNKLLECYFTRSFYKHILATLVKYTDMESEDYTFYKGLEFLMEHDVADLGYDLTFSTDISEFGVTEVRDLIPNGRNIAVTAENKQDYARLVCQMKMTGAIRKQLSAFLEGFYNIIPRRLISIFNEQELELLLSGLPTIDVDDLKANSEYHKYQANSLQIVWFWRALRSFDQTDKAKFMQFVTGSSKVPLQGFGALEGMNGPQKFQIHRDDRSTDRLPSAHTCFNQLDLPAYETYDKLRTYLLKAVQECSEGFGFA
jgi:E3 ubiquitin-protein ligase HUWE1